MVTCSLLVLLIVSLFAVSNSPSVSAQAPRTVLFSAASESNLDVLFEKNNECANHSDYRRRTGFSAV